MSSKGYKKKYVQQAKFYHEKGYLVLVAINMMLWLLLAMRTWSDQTFHVAVPSW
ncbi:hypothetical protein [Streptococcus sp. E29BA]|uniref:hypothetical protein n=1 Tax=Streptococcus sp. E29BA TaxID=3278716 RepID=UPI00359E7C37